MLLAGSPADSIHLLVSLSMEWLSFLIAWGGWAQGCLSQENQEEAGFMTYFQQSCSVTSTSHVATSVQLEGQGSHFSMEGKLQASFLEEHI